MIHDMPTKHHIYKETMVKKAPSQEANVKDLKMAHLLVLSTINFLLENHSSAYPSQSKISFIIGYSRRQVSRIIAELCRMRLMSKETFFNHETRINETCIYHIAGWLKTTEQKHAIKRRINALTFCKIRSWITRPAADVSRYILKVSTSIDISLLLGAVALQKRENWLRRFDIWPFPPPSFIKNQSLIQMVHQDPEVEANIHLKKGHEYEEPTLGHPGPVTIGHRTAPTGFQYEGITPSCPESEDTQDYWEPSEVYQSSMSERSIEFEVPGSSEPEEYNAITLFGT